MKRHLSAGVTLALAAIVVVGLVQGPPPSDGERRLNLARQLRCPQCQVSVADSNAVVAQTMRTIIDEQLAAGRSDEEILQYFVDRYGEWVLTRPRWGGSTLLLWLLPVLAAGAGAWAIARLRSRREGP